MRVQVYYNLHKECLSVRHKGKVIEHAQSVILQNASFHVQPAGRARVLKEKRKNVHAYVAGDMAESFWFTEPSASIWTATQHVTYNPYKYRTFVDKLTGKPITKAPVVLIHGKSITVGQYSRGGQMVRRLSAKE